MGSTPSPPDPAALATAQSEANRVNVISPTGALTYGTTGPDGQFAPGANHATVSINETPHQRAQRLAREGIATDLTDIAGQRVAGLPGDQFSIAGGGPQTSIDAGGFQALGGLGAQQQFQPGNYDAARGRAEDAVYQRGLSRLTPQFEDQDERLSQDLQNRGIPIGSEAYTRAMRDKAFGQNDARLNLERDAIGAGRAEQAQQYGQALGTAQFGESQRDALFAQQGQLRGQQVQEALQRGGFANAGRTQGIQEDLLVRNQGINEALQSLGGAPNMPLPQFTGAQPIDTMTPALAAYQGQNQRYGANIGGLASLGSAAAMGYFLK